MKRMLILSVFFLVSAAVNTVFAQEQAVPAPAPEADLSQYIYSYGTVLSATTAELTLQEYDYDSDVEKEVVYQVAADIKLEGIKAVTDLVAEDVVEVYYEGTDGKRTAKIIRKETIEEENVIAEEATEEGDM